MDKKKTDIQHDGDDGRLSLLYHYNSTFKSY